MWLLNTKNAELQFFSSPEDVPTGYAILSHRWDASDKGVDFNKLYTIQNAYKHTGENAPWDYVPEKIRKFCILAKSLGFEWGWVDSCCINKQDNFEYSEAINSMFRWYSTAEVCFAYLADVPKGCNPWDCNSPFRKSIWYTRGWTLQELIAPHNVLFVCQDWKVIGDKQGLSRLLEEITGILSQILTGEMHFTSISVAERMSWASNRVTERIEDQAYCLMGLFNVNMPPIHGEGHRAFQRLQQEIMKQTCDPSLFAWGGLISCHRRGVTPLSRNEDDDEIFTNWTRDPVYLLARSPRDFNLKSSNSTGVIWEMNANKPLEPVLRWHCKNFPGRSEPPFGKFSMPRFSATNYGTKCYLPVFHVAKFNIDVAILFCTSSSNHLGLLLHPSPDKLADEDNPRYRVGHAFEDDRTSRVFARLVLLGEVYRSIKFFGEYVRKIQWKTFYIVDSRPTHMTATLDPLNICNRLHLATAPTPPFRIPNYLVIYLSSLGLELSDINPLAAHGDILAVLRFTDAVIPGPDSFRVALGTCSKGDSRKGDAERKRVATDAMNVYVSSSPPTATRLTGTMAAHWARVESYFEQTPSRGHDCAEDHIGTSEGWTAVETGWTKNFVMDVTRTVQLSLSRSRLSTTASNTSFDVHITLSGEAFQNLMQRKGARPISAPSRMQFDRGSSSGQALVSPQFDSEVRVQSIEGDESMDSD